MIYYVDIDETICHYDGERHYPDAKPICDNIEKINQLYEQGNKVVYWTARGTTTGIDWTETTEKQLNDWGAKYHELKLKKPNYDVFICDKAISSERFFKKCIKQY
jgi:hypothetical protein